MAFRRSTFVFGSRSKVDTRTQCNPVCGVQVEYGAVNGTCRAYRYARVAVFSELCSCACAYVCVAMTKCCGVCFLFMWHDESVTDFRNMNVSKCFIVSSGTNQHTAVIDRCSHTRSARTRAKAIHTHKYAHAYTHIHTSRTCKRS